MAKYGMKTVLCGAMLGSFLTGYASSVISSTLGQPSWYTTMGLSLDPTSPSYGKTLDIQAAANGLFYGGGVFGTLITAWFSERWGRLMGFKVAAAFHILGSALQTGAVNQAMYLVSRFIAGFASGQTSAAMITYFSEISLPRSRGLIGGLHALMIENGACVASWIGVGTFFAKNGTFGWRFPISLSVLLSLMLLVVSFLLPESPRWLMRYGREEEAFVVLASLHKTSNSSDENVAEREFQQIKLQSDADHAAVATHGKWQLFTDSSYRRRLVVGFGLVFFVQSCGFLVIFNYGTTLYTSLGFSASESLIALSGWITWTSVCIYIGNVCVDKLGRRPVLMVGFVSLSLCLAIFTACLSKYLETQEKKWAIPAVTFIYLSAIPFGGCLDQNQFTVVSEIFPNHLRTMASCIAISALYLCQTLWLNLAPTAIDQISWKYYLVFVILGFCGTFHVYFFIPETSGVPLEELDALFGREVAVRMDEIDVSMAHEGDEKNGMQHVEKASLKV